MGAARVWVELGPGDLVRADNITKICAGGARQLNVKVVGEREARQLELVLPDSFPASWTAAAARHFADQLDPVLLAHGLVDAIADAAESMAGGLEIGLRVNLSLYTIGWSLRQAGRHGDYPRPSASFWGFQFERDADDEEDDEEIDLSAIEPLPVWTADGWSKPGEGRAATTDKEDPDAED